MRRRRQGDMTLSGEEARGGVKADPAGAGDIDLRPGVQVGEIGGGALGAFPRFDVRHELDEVARHEPRSEAKAPQKLDEQPGAVPAGAGA